MMVTLSHDNNVHRRGRQQEEKQEAGFAFTVNCLDGDSVDLRRRRESCLELKLSAAAPPLQFFLPNPTVEVLMFVMHMFMFHGMK